jgi:hypothetical protein
LALLYPGPNTPNFSMLYWRVLVIRQTKRDSYYRFMKINRIATMAALAAGLFTMSASASTLALVGPDQTRGSFITFQHNSADVSGFAGVLNFTIDGGADLFSFFCVDITTPAYYTPYEAVALPPASTINHGAQVAWLFTHFASSVNSVVTGTALQLAIWDVIYDGGDGLANGSLRGVGYLPNDILAQAASYISASAGMSASDAVIWQSVLGATDRQMQIGQVPEPSSLAMMATGLGLAVIGLRRKK